MSDTVPRVRPGDLLRIRSERWRVTTHASFGGTAIVEVAGIDAENRGRRSRFVLPFEPVEMLPVSATPRVVRPARWRRSARSILADALPSPTSLRTAARADFGLLPFQLQPALAIARGLATRVLIADAVGLGKTVQAALIVAEALARRHDGHALIVCPAGLREQWQQELETRFGLAAAVLDAGVLATRGASAFVNPWTTEAIGVTSIDYIKRTEVLRALQEMVWDVVVFDEAHALSGRSDRTAAAAAVAARARSVVMLTATPHSGDEDSFARMCDIGRLPGDAPLLVFRRTRADVAIADTRRSRCIRVRPGLEERRMHRVLSEYADNVHRARTDTAPAAGLAMTVLARRAYSSAYALARSIERRMSLLDGSSAGPPQLALPFAMVSADDDEPLAELSAPGLADAQEEHEQLERVLACAHAACSAGERKLHRLRQLLRRTGEPALVFTEYRDTLAHVAGSLADLNCVLLHGGMTVSERRDAARRFTAGDARVMLATDAASEGLNLHHRCRLVITLELPWTPLRLEQRIGRVDRIGQARPVHAIHLVARGTAEESMIDRLRTRDERAQASLEAATGSSPDLDHEARAEAARIATARDWLRGGSDVAEARPVVTLIRSREVSPHGWWLWRLAVDTSDRELLWDANAAVFATVSGLRGTSAEAVRRMAGAEVIEAAVAAQQQHVEAFARELRLPLARALERERAIADAIAVQRGALTRALVQHGLFDGRAERDASVRAAILDAASTRCLARLDELSRAEAPTSGLRQLAFAVFIG